MNAVGWWSVLGCFALLAFITWFRGRRIKQIREGAQTGTISKGAWVVIGITVVFYICANIFYFMTR